MCRQNLTCLCSRYLKFGDNRNCLDLFAPWELDVVTDPEWRHRRALSGIHASCWCRQHFAQRDFNSGNVLGGERFQVCAHEATKEGSSNIVRVAFFEITLVWTCQTTRSGDACMLSFMMTSESRIVGKMTYRS
jgi:hypothetical protein